MKFFALAILSFGLLIVSCSRNQGSPPSAGTVKSSPPIPGPDKLEIMKMLRNGSYESLMRELDSLARNFEKDTLHEEYFWRAFDTFDVSDTSVEKYLNEWIREYPQCANAYASRAIFYTRVGWSIRGYDWARNVPEEHWNGMQNYFEKAWSDACHGLVIDSLNLPCYDALITISMHYSDKNLTGAIFDNALKVYPASFNIWKSYMWSLLPRWGGSHEEMDLLAQQSIRYLSLNPRLKVLQGYVAFDEGWNLEYDSSYASAIEKLDTAISYGESAVFYERRGDCYYDLENYDQALMDYDHALQLSPQDPWTLSSKVYALFYSGDLDQAHETAKEALAISPADSNVKEAYELACGTKSDANFHRSKGFRIMKTSNENETALSEFDLAVEEDTSNYLNYYARGYCYRYLGRYDSAISDFRRVLSLKSGYLDAYSNLGWLNMQLGKYDDAATDYSAEIAATPEYYNAYVGRAYCYHQLGRNEEALQDLKTACDLGCEQACESYRKITGQ
ncbi:MAG TPA: tetratricopeptide repeat protein [Candidatus Acidoferrales bacterium]|nr:tetratricopeptide repeat protein [Candidatus Acidoferrales bacterium]